VTETDLRDLGIHRLPIPVPFPQAGGPVNVYLVEERDGGVLMFDSGLGTPEAEAALAEGFDGMGRRFDEVTRIVLSHGHVDHYGAARTVMERAGRAIPVLAHRADIPKIAESGWRWRDRLPLYLAYLAKLGVPKELVSVVGREAGRGFGMARRVAEVTPLEPGALLHGKHVALEVHHMPGHTSGLLCLYDRRHRLLFSGDHLLEKVSPNPIIELGPAGEEGAFRPLIAYLESIERVEAMEVDLVLPGHGAPFGQHRRVIDGLLEFQRRRQARVREALAGEPRSGYEVARALFPAAGAADLFLVMSETIAHLEVLEAHGEVSRALEGETYRFALTRA
jgi:glyoxylase-like metal-dependent hydrolase (beta-lactamase superfamily II)